MIQLKKANQRAFTLKAAAPVKTAKPVEVAMVVVATGPRIPEQAIANARFNIAREARRIVLQRDANARAAAFLKASGRTITLQH